MDTIEARRSSGSYWRPCLANTPEVLLLLDSYGLFDTLLLLAFPVNAQSLTKHRTAICSLQPSMITRNSFEIISPADLKNYQTAEEDF